MGLPASERSRRNREKRIANGLCPICGKNKLIGEYKTCQACRDKLIASNDARRSHLKSAGICYICGNNPASASRNTCETCASKQREDNHTRRAKLLEAGICIACSFYPAAENLQYCSSCHQRRLERHQENRRKRKENGVCSNCPNPVGPQSNRLCNYHWNLYNDRQREAKYDGNRATVLKRDNFHCRICHNGGPDQRLHIHHIDRNQNNNDLENLITLCQYCHNAVTDLLLCKSPLKVIEFVKVHYFKSESLARH